MNDDMNTMPIPELITAIRDKAKTLDMLTGLVLNVLCNRMAQQQKRIEELENDSNSQTK